MTIETGNFPRDNTVGMIAGKLEEQNNILRAWATKAGAVIKIEDWAAIQSIVRSGAASKVFAIGDQLECKKGATVLSWDIIGFDHDIPVDTNHKHSMTLQLHDCISAFQYDAPEAMYYAETVLPAGTYHFCFNQQPSWLIDQGKTWQFTLTTAVPAGGQICINGGASTAPTTAMVYINGTSTAATQTVAITEGMAGIALTPINHVHRVPYGSNNWEASALRQWINSGSAANAWWTPKSNFDRPSAGVATAGFLDAVDNDFLDVIGKVKKRTILNTLNEGGGYVDTQERFFLPAMSEIYMTYANNINEGDPYDYYKLFSDLVVAGNGKDSNRVKRLIGGTSAQSWWIRSPYPSNANSVYVVNTGGVLDSYSASGSHGVAPACNIV